MQRRFVKSDKIERLYDFIDISYFDDNKVGFEIHDGKTNSEEILYELVTPPTP